MNRKTSADFTRRSFLKGGAIASLGVTAALAGLTGCSSGAASEGSQSAEVSEGGVSLANCEIIDSDVLVIGCGVSGSIAAKYAYDYGATVTVVDKGPFQFSGAGGMNFDIQIASLKETEEIPMDPGMLADLEAESIKKAAHPFNIWDALAEYVNDGLATPRRLEDGSMFDNAKVLPQTTCFGQYGLMRVFSDAVSQRGVTVYDQTMVTGIIGNNGTCQGVVGIHIPTGAYRIFRAKAVIKATGACTQMNGWSTVNAYSTVGPDATGDVDIAAYRAGCDLIGCEWFHYDTHSIGIPGISAAFNSGFCADNNDVDRIANSEGDYFLIEPMDGGRDRALFFKLCAQEVIAGRCTENGGLWLDCTEESLALMRPTFKRNVQLWKEKFGVDLVKEGRVEVALQCFEHNGTPAVDDKLMSPTLKGLFDVRGGTAIGEGGGLSAVSAMRFGKYAAYCANEYVKGLGEGDQVDMNWGSALEEVARVDEILNRSSDDGIRPHVIRHEIQNACRAALAPGGDAAQFEAGIAELERIISEDLPKQVVLNKSKIFNTDWKQAVENYNLAILSLASLKSMLMREESRSQHLRSDFPEASEYWGQHNIAVRLVDGEMLLEAVPVN